MRYHSKQELVSSMRTEYDSLQQLLEAIPDERYHEQHVWGDGWTIHDLVAHLGAWHEMFLLWYRDGVAGRNPTMPAPGFKWNETPELNRAIWRQHHDRPTEAVRSEFRRSHKEILELVEGLPEDALLQPGHFEWTGRHPLTTYIGPNTASHYRFASKVIKRWLKRRDAHDQWRT